MLGNSITTTTTTSYRSQATTTMMDTNKPSGRETIKTEGGTTRSSIPSILIPNTSKAGPLRRQRQGPTGRNPLLGRTETMQGRQEVLLLPSILHKTTPGILRTINPRCTTATTGGIPTTNTTENRPILPHSSSDRNPTTTDTISPPLLHHRRRRLILHIPTTTTLLPRKPSCLHRRVTDLLPTCPGTKTIIVLAVALPSPGGARPPTAPLHTRLWLTREVVVTTILPMLRHKLLLHHTRIVITDTTRSVLPHRLPRIPPP
mmetsp:Transcript_28203/g.60514  ORF Transcript_28203/g.60514 Transcript_28203/m.60514 type:complete len:260 (-) Transcript_28203:1548-2327(-)